ncbi:hypothetical protein SKAU_G00043470 [Synaphobranchus kaupii]|uniref:Uncharacterized protein n=1 Tax=Synaphobranchus kaupii TaxID=118154 RepID=A0A9Q1G2J2_SYNKA|nr:hypothetical protein SKAU_G00043470 [Synaphobranchus kaupii]
MRGARPDGSGSAHPRSEGTSERTNGRCCRGEGKEDNNMSSRKVMAIQARKRRPKGKKDKAAHHRSHRKAGLQGWRQNMQIEKGNGAKDCV